MISRLKKLIFAIVGAKQKIQSKHAFNSRLVTVLSRNECVIHSRIMVGSGKNPVRPEGDYAPVWIPFTSREVIHYSAAEVCLLTLDIFTREFRKEWNAIEIILGSFDCAGAFDKAYRLTVFIEEVDVVLEVLKSGLPGVFFGRDVGWLFAPKLPIDLIDG